jgi:hypothetical protein
MPIVAVAVCPHPPLLVPELVPGDDPILAELRSACASAVDLLADAAPTELYLVGAGAGPTRRHPPGSRGSFTGYGPAVEVAFAGGPPADRPERLPLALLAGGWLARRGRVASLPCTGLAVAADLPPAGCAALGRELADTSARRALLVLGDGSARHSEHAPVHLDPRAEMFDAVVAGALAAADTDTLARLDPALAGELAAQGRAAWQVLAGAAGARTWTARLRYAGNPYGVGYFVASWSPDGA